MGDEDRVLLKLICFSQKELADTIGATYSTLRNWSSGKDEIPAEYHAALAAFMREHGKRLVDAAEELDRK